MIQIRLIFLSFALLTIISCSSTVDTHRQNQFIESIQTKPAIGVSFVSIRFRTAERHTSGNTSILSALFNLENVKHLPVQAYKALPSFIKTKLVDDLRKAGFESIAMETTGQNIAIEDSHNPFFEQHPKYEYAMNVIVEQFDGGARKAIERGDNVKLRVLWQFVNRMGKPVYEINTEVETDEHNGMRRIEEHFIEVVTKLYKQNQAQFIRQFKRQMNRT